MLNTGNCRFTDPTKKVPWRPRDARAAGQSRPTCDPRWDLHKRNPSARYRTDIEKASTVSDSGCFDFEHIIGHDPLGHAPLRRVDTLLRVPRYARKHSGSQDSTVAATEGEGAQRVGSPYQLAIAIHQMRFRDKDGSAGGNPPPAS